MLCEYRGKLLCTAEASCRSDASSQVLEPSLPGDAPGRQELPYAGRSSGFAEKQVFHRRAALRGVYRRPRRHRGPRPVYQRLPESSCTEPSGSRSWLKQQAWGRTGPRSTTSVLRSDPEKAVPWWWRRVRSALERMVHVFSLGHPKRVLRSCSWTMANGTGPASGLAKRDWVDEFMASQAKPDLGEAGSRGRQSI